MKNIDIGQLCYYHVSYNNNVMLKSARLISNRQELIQFLNALAEELFFDKINRPGTKWKVLDTVKPLIERHPVFLKIAVSDLLTRIPLQLLPLLQRSIFSCFFLFHANTNAERGISG